MAALNKRNANAKSDDEWDLPHDMAPPCVFALSRAAAGNVRGGMVGVTARKSVGPKLRQVARPDPKAAGESGFCRLSGTGRSELGARSFSCGAVPPAWCDQIPTPAGNQLYP
jgi:hypothetical protein